MRLRRLGMLMLAAAMAIGTAVFVRGMAAPTPLVVDADGVPAPAPVMIDTVDVLVAREDLPAGTFLTEDALEWQPWPEETVADIYMIRDTDETGIAALTGAVVRTGLKEGQPLLDSVLVHPGERGFLAAVLEPGHRAVSVPVDATTGISGFVFPGDRVDLLMAMRLKLYDEEGETKGGTRYATVTLISGVRVLAIDQTVENIEGEARVAKTATLEVTPKQAETVALGLDMGSRLSLSLHALADSGEAVTLASAGLPLKSASTTDSEVMSRHGIAWGIAGTGQTKGNEAVVNVLRGDQSSESKLENR